MRIILLGAPGSGKGTQARKLVNKYKVPQVSTGDILRASVQAGSDTGKQVEQIMKQGDLVPDDLVMLLLTERLRKSDTRRGFILDGFPRNIPQAQELDTRMGWVSRPIQMVVNLEVNESILLKRITGRLTCAKCGEIYNIYLNPPESEGKCNLCTGKLVQRTDDTEETVRSRLNVYHRETEMLAQYYRAQHKLRTLPADGDAESIFARLSEMVDTEIRPLENKLVSVHGEDDIDATHTTIIGGKIVRESGSTDSRTSRMHLQRAQAEESGKSVGDKKIKTSTKKKVDLKKGSSDTAQKPGSEKKAGARKGGPKTEKADRKTTSRVKKADAGAKKTAVARVAAKKSKTSKAVPKKKVTAKSPKKVTRKKATSARVSTQPVKTKVTAKKIVKKKAAKKRVVKKKISAKIATGKAAKPAVGKKKAPAKVKVVGKSAGKKKVLKKKVANRKVAKTKATKTVKKRVAAKSTAARPASKKVAKKLAGKTAPKKKTTSKKKAAAGKTNRRKGG